MERNRKQEALTLASLSESTKHAIQARHHRLQVAKKKQMLCSVAKKLQAKLKAALSKSPRLQNAAQRVRATSLSGVTQTKRHTHQYQQAKSLEAKLQKRLVASKRRFDQTKEKLVQMDSKVHRRVKYELSSADARAQEIIRRAEAKASAVRKQAAQRAKRELANLKEQELESTEDARSEVVATRRKVKRVKKLVLKTSKLFHKAQGKAWHLMSKTEEIQQLADHAASRMARSKQSLKRVQSEIERLEH
jgi:hypothetical protein